MEDNNTKNKLSENTSRLVAISTLRRIRSLVDGYEEQDRKNRRKAIVLFAILFVLLVTLIYFVLYSAAETTILKTEKKLNNSYGATIIKAAPVRVMLRDDEAVVVYSAIYHFDDTINPALDLA